MVYFVILTSLYGWSIYIENLSIIKWMKRFKRWYKKLTWFMYVIFTSWSVIFVVICRYTEYDLHYIAIFTQLGASVVASTLLVSDKKLFVPILIYIDVTFKYLFSSCWYMVWICSICIFSYFFCCTCSMLHTIQIN